MTKSTDPEDSKSLLKQLSDFELALKSGLSQGELDMLNSVLESLAESANEKGDIPKEVENKIKKDVENLFRSNGR